jgi:predicted nucleic acid-binding protein
MADDVLLDTNVILRFVLGDDQAHQEQAKRLFRQAVDGEVRLLLPTLVLAQVVWTLESFYQASRKYITNVLCALLATPGVISQEPRVIPRCVEIYSAYNVEIVDAYLVALAEESKTFTLATFDRRHFRRFSNLKLIP